MVVTRLERVSGSLRLHASVVYDRDGRLGKVEVVLEVVVVMVVEEKKDKSKQK